MDNSISIIKSFLKEKEDTISSLVKEFRSAVAKLTVVECEAKELSEDCTLKQRQHGVIEDLLKKESQAILNVILSQNTAISNGSMRRMELAESILNQSLQKLAAIEELALSAFDGHNLMNYLNDISESYYILERQNHGKRFELQKAAREKMFKYQDVKEQYQLLTDILFEMTELKKEEEEQEANSYQLIIDLMRTNGQLKKKLQDKLLFKK